MDHLLDAEPVAISASSAGFIQGRPNTMAHLTVYFEGGALAHLNVNWLAPVKIRQTLIGGSRKMVIYDDMENSEKVKIYDRGVDVGDDPEAAYERMVSYRVGDMRAPALSTKEALVTEMQEFARCIDTGRPPAHRRRDRPPRRRAPRRRHPFLRDARPAGRARRSSQGFVNDPVPRPACPVRRPPDRARGRRPRDPALRRLRPRPRRRALRGGLRRLLRRRARRSPSTPAPRRCTSRCSPPASARATRSSPSPRPSSRRPPPSSTPARRRSSSTSTRRPGRWTRR